MRMRSHPRSRARSAFSSGTNDPIEQLGNAIAGRGRCLIVLDNFEQVVSHAAATLGQWMGKASEARFLVTSREKLGLGELETVQAVESHVARGGPRAVDGPGAMASSRP